MDKYKKVLISSRITADRAEQIKLLASEKQILITDVMQLIVDYFFTEKHDEPLKQKECIVLEDMQLVTVAAILECSEKLGKTYPQTIDLLFAKVMELAGHVSPEYVEKAKLLLNK